MWSNFAGFDPREEIAPVDAPPAHQFNARNPPFVAPTPNRFARHARHARRREHIDGVLQRQLDEVEL